jgi:hypothetical protein
VTEAGDPLAELRALAASKAPAPPGLERYLEQVRTRAWTITDRDVEAPTAAGYSEDEIFEQTVGAALAEGLRRLDAAARVIG